MKQIINEAVLATILNVMSDCKLNLTKFNHCQLLKHHGSMPFLLILLLSILFRFQKAKSIIEIMGEEFKILGEYKNAKL